MTLQFDEDRHIYTRNGKVLPSVTQIIAPIIEYPDAISEEVMAHAKLRGQAVHKACEIIDLGMEIDGPLDEQIEPYVDAWRLFVKEKGAIITHTEQRLHHPTMHYAGTLDARAQIDGEEWLIDRKAITTLHPAIGVQLAGYEGMLGKKMRRAAVQLKPDGRYVFREYNAKSDWPVFVSLLTIHNWRLNNGKHAHV